MGRPNERKARQYRYLETDHLLHGKSSKSKYSCDEHGQWWYRTKQHRLRAVMRVCEVCGDEFPDRKQNRPARTCSKRECRRTVLKQWWEKQGSGARGRGSTHYNWRGGIRVSRSGYIEVWMPDHPELKGTTRKYIRRCRWVMEQQLGRQLEIWEEVHHKNGIKHDDRPDNLEIWITSHPAGNRDYYCPRCDCEQCMAKRSNRQHAMRAEA